MDNTQLGRKVVDVMDCNPEQFSMSTWGEVTDCGTVACLAGTAMLQSGYRLRDGAFYRPDGSFVTNEGREAKNLLGLTDEEEYAPGAGGTIWYDFNGGPDRFRKLVEESEGNI